MKEIVLLEYIICTLFIVFFHGDFSFNQNIYTYNNYTYQQRHVLVSTNRQGLLKLLVFALADRLN